MTLLSSLAAGDRDVSVHGSSLLRVCRNYLAFALTSLLPLLPQFTLEPYPTILVALSRARIAVVDDDSAVRVE